MGTTAYALPRLLPAKEEARLGHSPGTSAQANPPTCSFLSTLSIILAKAFLRLSLRSFPCEPAFLFARVWPVLRLNASPCLLQVPPHLSLLGVPHGNLYHC